MQQYSKVYAQALYEIAAEDGQEQQLLDEITEVGRLMDETPELREVMTSPAFSNEERIDIINRSFMIWFISLFLTNVPIRYCSFRLRQDGLNVIIRGHLFLQEQ